jgi:hypothetical protein
MPAKSTTPATCLVIESNAVTSNQQIGIDLLTKTHPPTPNDLIAGIDHVEGLLMCTCQATHTKQSRGQLLFKRRRMMWTSHELHKTKHQIYKLLYFKDLLHIAILRNSNKR